MGRVCGTNVERRMYIEYWWESQKEGDHWEGRDVGGSITLKWVLER
jgi:hypothetical protein